MEETAKLPDSGLIAYFGPGLTHAASRVLEERGLALHRIAPDMPDAELPKAASAFIYGLGLEHPIRAALQREAVRRGLPVLSDLAMLGELASQISVPQTHRALITGSAGKTFTSALLVRLLAQAGRDTMEIEAERGFLNALGATSEYLILRCKPSEVAFSARIPFAGALVLNLFERNGVAVGEKARHACADLLIATPTGLLGTDDVGAQALLMAVRRASPSAARGILPVSGGSTLSDGWFAIDRAVYACRNGRTQRVAGYAESTVLLGEHFAQDAAAAAAMASHFGVSDDQIAAGLKAFRGLEGRFDCIGTEGRMVFVDDRHATCEASTAAAISSCPDVFWIGSKPGDLPKKVKASMRGNFILTATDGSGPPVDGVVTFKDASEATDAAIRAAQELLMREPEASPVILYSPGAAGFTRQGDLFKVKSLAFLSEGGRAHA